MGSRTFGGLGWRTASAAVLAMAVAAAPAFAHHSFAMYDHAKTYRWQGTVVNYDWRNPHIYVDVAFAEGGDKTWSLEGTAIPMLTRLGWSSKTVKPGDKITAQFAPMKNGSAAGILIKMTLPNGQEINTGLPGQDSYAKPE